MNVPATREGCPFEERLQAGIDGELSAGEDLDLRGHLADCDSCRGHWSELTALSAELVGFFAERERLAPALSIPGVPTAAPVARAPAPNRSAPTVLEAEAAPTVREAQIIVPPGQVPVPPPKPAPAGQALLGAKGGKGGVPRRIGGYRIEAELARGGMGCVYRAVQISMDRPVALKVLAPELAADAEFVARFVREARTAATVTHPNLVSIYEVGQDGEQIFYSMQLVHGEDAEDVLLREGPFSQRRAAEIVLAVSRALVAAAEKHVVHRDIKPANILLTREGGVKLADLGLAKALESEDANLTQTRTVIGSPNYMSPEQAHDLRNADARSDIYSLGATLVHLITGRIPFGKGSPVVVIARVLRDPAPVPEKVHGTPVDPALRQIMLRALSKDPAARQQDAASLVAELEAYLAGRELPQASAPSKAGLAKSSGKGKAPSSDSTRQRARRRRRSGRTRRPETGASERVSRAHKLPARRSGLPPWVWGVAAAFLGALGLFALQGEEPRPEPEVALATPTATPPPPPTATPPPTPTPALVATPAAVEAFLRWPQEEEHLLGERYRAARELLAAHPVGPWVAELKQAEEQVTSELARLYEELDGRAGSLRAEDRLQEACRLYEGYVADYGEVPAQARARLVANELTAEIRERLKSDLDRVDRLVAEGRRDEARELLAEVARYAGSERADEARAALRLDDPVEEAAARRVLAAALLARARARFEEGALAPAADILARLRREYAPLGELAPEVDALARAIAQAQSPAGQPAAPDGQPADASRLELLASLLQGQLEVGEEGRVTLRYAFADAREAEDWLPVSPEGDWRQQALQGALAQLQQDAPGLPPPWSIKGKVLVGHGHERRQLLLDFAPDEPVEVELESKGCWQNLLVGLRSSHSYVAGMGYVLDELPINDLIERAGQGRRPGAARRFLEPVEATIAASRERGPSLAIFRERGLYEHEELRALRAPKKKGLEFRVRLEPSGEGHSLALRAGKKIDERVALSRQSERVRIRLLTFGAVVAWDGIVVRGTLSARVFQRLERAIRQAGQQDLDALRGEFLKQLAESGGSRGPRGR